MAVSFKRLGPILSGSDDCFIVQSIDNLVNLSIIYRETQRTVRVGWERKLLNDDTLLQFLFVSVDYYLQNKPTY